MKVCQFDLKNIGFLGLDDRILPSLPIRVNKFSQIIRLLMTFFTYIFGVQKVMNFMLAFYF